MQLIAEGHSNKKIALELGISLKTVETHRAAIIKKLNLSSSAALVRYAVRNKLVEGLDCVPGSKHPRHRGLANTQTTLQSCALDQPKLR